MRASLNFASLELPMCVFSQFCSNHLLKNVEIVLNCDIFMINSIMNDMESLKINEYWNVLHDFFPFILVIHFNCRYWMCSILNVLTALKCHNICKLIVSHWRAIVCELVADRKSELRLFHERFQLRNHYVAELCRVMPSQQTGVKTCPQLLNNGQLNLSMSTSIDSSC